MALARGLWGGFSPEVWAAPSERSTEAPSRSLTWLLAGGLGSCHWLESSISYHVDLCSQDGSWLPPELVSKKGRHHYVLYALASDMTHHHFCHAQLVTQTMGEGTTRGVNTSRSGSRGHLRGWLPPSGTREGQNTLDLYFPSTLLGGCPG